MLLPCLLSKDGHNRTLDQEASFERVPPSKDRPPATDHPLVLDPSEPLPMGGSLSISAALYLRLKTNSEQRQNSAACFFELHLDLVLDFVFVLNIEWASLAIVLVRQ